ncbi:MAG: Trm112 family protein [Elusimicrobia bacterium]|nr:Trm112 family protein [Elusimicrobiota bacterium]
MEDRARDPLPLDLLACPACRGALEDKASMLRCAACGRGYPVDDGIPNFVVSSGNL